jgi:hypothetical protein
VRGDQRFVVFVDVIAPARRELLPGPHHPLARIIAGEDVNHIADAADSDAYRNDPRFREFVDTGVCRSLLGVALRKDKTLLGYVVVYRQEVRSFTDKQVTLLQNFRRPAHSRPLMRRNFSPEPKSRGCYFGLNGPPCVTKTQSSHRHVRDKIIESAKLDGLNPQH